MRDGQAGLGHPPWRGGGGGRGCGQACGVSARGSRGGFKRDLNALRLDASANSSFHFLFHHPYIAAISPYNISPAKPWVSS